MAIDRVVYVAAHGGFAGQPVPLGGGAAIANWLTEEWGRTRPFALDAITPSILGTEAPGARDLVNFNEGEYARFCRRFEAVATERVLRQYDPSRTSVLVNDISEAPDFARLRAAGFRIVTIYHVDVVAYIAAIYLKGWIAPKALVGLHRLIGGIYPDILKLIFEKQRASVECSDAIVVPSAEMKRIIQECYGPRAKVEVIPWGARWIAYSEEEIAKEAARLRAELGIKPGQKVLLTLSRLSPEKGHDVLLQALRDWDRDAVLVICGEPAFMQGVAYSAKLRKLAQRMKHVRVVFPGYVDGLRKAGFFRLADVYCFPSRHESYGLTLMEAIDAGCPVVCLDHAGAKEIVHPGDGEVVRAEGLLAAVERTLACQRRPPGNAQPRFEQAAARLADLLRPA
jgi:glycosyltransferase involved in cell wall biosynthesis